MCSVSDIPVVGKILDAISEATVVALKREFSYLFCYKSYVSDLQDKINELGRHEEDINGKIVRDKNDAKTIKRHVEEWQKDAVEIKSQVEEFIKEYQARTSWRCFQVLRFPNPYSRFRLGREAAKKTVKVTGLIEPGKEYVGGEISTLPQFGDATDYISTTEYLRFGSRQDAYNQIWDALKKEDGSTVVGIWGMPGAGKTTMMELVSDKAKKEGIFEWVARVDVGQGVDVEKLQGKLASSLNLHFSQEVDNENKKAVVLATRLAEGRKFLVILDDVWEEIPLKKIGIPFGDDGSGIKGCKILLTSRKRDVCTSNKCVDPVEIKALTNEEAWDLFKENVGTSTIDALRDNSLAHKVCGECAGLPLIVVAVGKALREKPEDSWNDALDQFKNSNIQHIPGIDPNVYVRLNFSFKQLHEDAKSCLLLCSLFDEDAKIPIEQLITLVKGSRLLEGLDTIERARTRVSSKVNNLISSSLVIEVDADTIKLHDIIRDVAKFEAATDPKYAFLSQSSNSGWLDYVDYNSRKLIDLHFESDDDVVIPDDLACEGLHTLLLSFRNDSQRLPDSFFNGLGKLRHLFLENVSFSPPPSSLQKLADLRILTLESCRLSDISFINFFEKLEMLVIRWINLEDFTLDLRVLKHLQMLDLIGCLGIVMNQLALSSLFKLEELHIPDGFRICQEGTNQDCPFYLELNKLTGLRSLSIHLKDAISCPDTNICQNLLRFKISIGVGHYYWEDRSTMTKSLRVCEDSLEGGVKTLMKRAEEVILITVSGLKNFVSNEEAFVDMTRLEIVNCSGADHLARIPQNRRLHQTLSFSKLSKLEIRSSGFTYLFCPSVARCLGQLVDLRIEDCEMMEEIIRNESPTEEIIVFPKLRTVRLSRLPKLTRIMSSTTTEDNTAISSPVGSLFNGKVIFPALEILEVESLSNNLRNVFLPSVVRDQVHLEKLSIKSCKMMKEIIAPTGESREEVSVDEIVFPMLKELTLNQLLACNSFWCTDGSEETLFSEKVVLPCLEKLEIVDMEIRAIWVKPCHKDGSFSRLKNLIVGSCHKLENVIPFAMIQRLQQSLEVLAVFNCNSVISEIEVQNGVCLRRLWDLDLHSLPNLTQTGLNSMEVTAYPNLKYLNIRECNNLRYVFLPSVARDSVFLKILFVSSCEKMKQIIAPVGEGQEEIEDDIVFPELRFLELDGLPQFCNMGHKVAFPRMKDLILNEREFDDYLEFNGRESSDDE